MSYLRFFTGNALIQFRYHIFVQPLGTFTDLIRFQNTRQCVQNKNSLEHIGGI